jgi:nucleoid DNA-binding protein
LADGLLYAGEYGIVIGAGGTRGDMKNHRKKRRKKRIYDGAKRIKWSPSKNGKEVLIFALMNKEGYSFDEATQVVNSFVLVLWSLLMDGKKIELEGLGVLSIVHRAPFTVIEKHMKCPPTIMTKNKKSPNSVRLLQPVDLSYKED